MRVNRIHLRARGAAAVDCQLAFYPGYTVVHAPGREEASRLCSLLTAMLYPDPGLRTLEEWTGDASGDASVSLELSSDAYLISADLGARRLELSRLDSRSGRYEHECGGASEVDRHLREAGVPDPRLFRALCTHGLSTPLSAPEPERVEESVEHDEPSAGLPSDVEVARAEARIAVLRADHEALALLEHEYKQTFGELDARAALADIFEDADAHIAEYRERAAQLDRACEQIRHERRELLDQRLSLEGKPERHGLPIGFGLAVGLAGGIAGVLGSPIGVPALAGGAAISGIAVLLRQLAWQRQRAVEVAIAKLRVSERKEERIFGMNAGPVRGLLAALELDSVDGLETELEEYARCTKRLESLHESLTEARFAFPPEALAELIRLEEVLASDDAGEHLRAEALERSGQDGGDTVAAEPTPLPPDVAEPASEIDCDLSTPEGLVEGAARACGLAPEELISKLDAPLAAQLDILSDTAVERATCDDGVWTLHGASGDSAPFDALDEEELAIVRLAFQLALLEALGPEYGLPLLIGPDGDDLPNPERVGRALRRVGAAAQVVQITAGGESFGEHAARTLQLESPAPESDS